MGIVDDAGVFYFIDSEEPNGWPTAALDRRYRVTGKLFSDDRFQGIAGGPGTGGGDRIIEPSEIAEVTNQ